MSRIAVRPEPPTFNQPYLQSLLVCSCFKLSDNALSKRIQKLAGRDERETRFESSKGPAWIRVRIGRRAEEDDPESNVLGRCQVDCALESRFPPSRARKRPPNDWNEVREYLGLVLKQKADITYCEGRFFVPKTELPMEGFARLLLEVSAGVGEAKMNLIGASFDVQGYQQIEEVRWKLRPHKAEDDADELDLTISAFPDLNRFGGELEKVAQMLSKGVQELVVGTGE